MSRTFIFAAVAAGVAAGVTAALLVPAGNSHRTKPPAPGVGVVSRSGAAVELASTDKEATAAPSAPTEDQLGAADAGFSLALLRQLDSAPASQDGNLAVSPSSLGTALSMLELGARGATGRQMAQVLGQASESAVDQAAAWQALTADEAASAARAGIDLESANSIWTQDNMPMDPGFMAGLARYFAAGVWQSDFAGNPAAATGAVNAWVSAHTHGKIAQLFGPGQINTETRVVLANAEYFDAPWLVPFDSSRTAPGPFATSGRSSQSVPFMTTVAPMSLPVSTAGGLDAVQLAYKGSRFAALVIMPTSGPLENLVDGLRPASLQQIVGSLETNEVRLSLPRFELTDASNLTSVLESMGMPDVFNPTADLSGMSPDVAQVQTVEQKVYLKVTEQGTEAAAATGIGVGATAIEAKPLAITFNRPFLFLVRDTVTGAILFAAEVENPAG